MAFELKLPKLAGGARGSAATAEIEPSLTQGRPRSEAQGYDPLAAPSLAEQMRTAIAESKMPRKVPLVGHLPIVRQFQVLGVLLVTFVVLAVFVMFLDVRTASQATASTRDRDRNADAVAAPGAQHRARVAGAGRRVQGDQGQS